METITSRYEKIKIKVLIFKGGADLINYVAGKEITYLFESYHKLESKNMLGTEKCPCVGEIESYRFPPYTKETGFYTSI